MQPPKDFSNLFLDMNAFFASVEQQVQPPLRGKPVCVAPYTGNTGCCIAKSYEAKSFGVKTGSSVKEARLLCPQINIVESRPELYMFYHRQIAKVLQSFSPNVQAKSIDEFNIKLTGTDATEAKSIQMALKIKKAIQDSVGDYLKCSIGVSSSSWLSKLAGEFKKPDGLVVVTLKNLDTFYEKLALTDLPGINFAMERRLRQKDIMSPMDFYHRDLNSLISYFHHPGRVWFFRLRGYEVDEFFSSIKSVGHSHVLPPELRNLKDARKVLAKLAIKAAARLRKKNLYCRNVTLNIRFLGHEFFHKTISTDLINDSQSVQAAVLKIYDKMEMNGKPLLLAVTLGNLQKLKGYQPMLFRSFEKNRLSSQAIDEINDKYGSGTIHPASMCDIDNAAPNRIPFGSPDRLMF